MSARTPDEDLPDEVVETDDGTVEVDDDAEPEDEADLVDEGLPDDELEESLENEMEFERDTDADEHDEDRDEIDIRTPLTEPDALVSRLRLIGEQPLAERAESLTQLHDELRARLESGDPTPR